MSIVLKFDGVELANEKGTVYSLVDLGCVYTKAISSGKVLAFRNGYQVRGVKSKALKL